MPPRNRTTATLSAPRPIAPKKTASAAPASASPQIEAMLNERGFTWELRLGVDLGEIDREKSLHNQARVGKPLDQGTVARYVAALANGDEFPAIIAAETSSTGLLLNVDGNHRWEAHREAGRATIDAYVIIGASPQAITMLTFECNTKHGLPTNENERIHQALYLVDSGVTAEDAARRLGLKSSTVRTAANLAAVNTRAVESGIQRVRWDKLPASVRHRLGQISTDEGFASMAKLTLDAGLATEDIARAVNDMNTLKSSSKQEEYVQTLRGTYADRLQTGGVRHLNGGAAPVGRQRRTPPTHLGMALGQLGTLPPPTSIVERMTAEDRREWIKRVDAGVARLVAIREALSK